MSQDEEGQPAEGEIMGPWNKKRGPGGKSTSESSDEVREIQERGAGAGNLKRSRKFEARERARRTRTGVGDAEEPMADEDEEIQRKRETMPTFRESKVFGF